MPASRFRLDRFLRDRLPLIGLLAFVIALFFLRDGVWPSGVVFGWAALALSVGTLPFLADALGGTRRQRLAALAPYIVYLVAVLISSRLHPDDPSRAELLRQLAFVATVWAAAVVAARTGLSPWVAALLICLSLIVVQVLGPASLTDHYGRQTNYSAIEQWSGYPEIGLLAGLGAAAGAALAIGGGSRLALRVAGALLAGGFVAATVFLYSRFAIVTAIAAIGWVAIARLIARRRALGALFAATAAVLVLWVWMGPDARAERVRAVLTASAQSQEMSVRAAGWRAASAMRDAQPWFGVGPGRYPAEYGKYATERDPTHAYNIVLHVAAELGWIGLAAYLALWARVLWISFAAAADRGRAGTAALAVHGMLAAFFVRSQSEHFLANLYTSLRLLLLVGVLFGLAEAAHACRRRADADRANAVDAVNASDASDAADPGPWNSEISVR